MNLNNTTKSTEELKRQVLNDVKKVRDDIDEIKARMTPGQIIDDAIYYRRGGRNPGETFEHLKNNPIGTSFLAVGTLLLMEDSEHHSFEAQARDKVGDVKTKMTGMVDNARGKIEQVQGKAREIRGNIEAKLPKGKKGAVTEFGGTDEFLYGDAGEQISKVDDIKSTAKQGIESAKVSAKEGFENVKGSAKEGLEHVKERAQDLYQSASTSVRNLDPLTYMVLGAGLGTISGATIPVSEKELNFVDEKLQQRMIDFRLDLEKALNESANILKNEFIGGVSNVNFNLFK